MPFEGKPDYVPGILVTAEGADSNIPDLETFKRRVEMYGEEGKVYTYADAEGEHKIALKSRRDNHATLDVLS